MIKIGKLIEYDENIGTILDDEGIEHLVLKKDIICDELKVNDYVKFDSETIITSENERKIARFINKLTLKK